MAKLHIDWVESFIKENSNMIKITREQLKMEAAEDAVKEVRRVAQNVNNCLMEVEQSEGHTADFQDVCDLVGDEVCWVGKKFDAETLYRAMVGTMYGDMQSVAVKRLREDYNIEVIKGD